MKTSTWTIDPQGNVAKVGVFNFADFSVQCRTKSEATRLLLLRASAVLSNPPRLRIRNGAFLLISHNGSGFVCESGPLDRANCPLCISGAKSLADAEHGASFDYYSSDEYQVQHNANPV